MAPLWHTFVEPGKTKALLYVVDASSPETIGISTIHLTELLHAPGVEASLADAQKCSVSSNTEFIIAHIFLTPELSHRMPMS